MTRGLEALTCFRRHRQPNPLARSLRCLWRMRSAPGYWRGRRGASAESPRPVGDRPASRTVVRPAALSTLQPFKLQGTVRIYLRGPKSNYSQRTFFRALICLASLSTAIVTSINLVIGTRNNNINFPNKSDTMLIKGINFLSISPQPTLSQQIFMWLIIFPFEHWVSLS